MMERLKYLQSYNLPDAWIGAGFVRNRIWDYFHEIDPPSTLNDIDVIYFDDSATEKRLEKEIETSLRSHYPKENWSVKNQARMHLKHGHKPYTSSEEAISYWVETATCIACRLKSDTQTLEIIAPHGIGDLLNLKVRPSPHLKPSQAELYNGRIRNKGWEEKWPLLNIYFMDE